jgi:hypothetical protein
MNRRPAAVLLLACSLTVGGLVVSGGAAPIQSADLKEWLTYLASDELQGRPTFGAGLGLAAGYIQQHLAEWRVTPGGDGGEYLQTVKVLGVKVKSRSTVTVRVGSETATFKDADGIRFAANAGASRQLTLDHVEFVGYGLDLPAAQHADYAGMDVTDAAVIFLGADGPKTIDAGKYRRILGGRSRASVDQHRAAATVGPMAAARGNSRQRRDRPDRPSSAIDFTTARRLDQPLPPAVTAGDAFFEFLFSQAPVRYRDLKRRVAAGEELPRFRLDGVSLTFNVDVDYDVVRTQLTHNVVGIVEGSDPQLRQTYVAFGAHYDHVGYADEDPAVRPGAAPGRVTETAASDRIWNGADDDGSGTVALLALAKAFAASEPRPQRSLLFVWHAGEERGLLGSQYFADMPSVPIDRISAQLNIDMIGRNRNDDPAEGNTVYLVGSDRISSELHDISRAANGALAAPLTLNYEFNDPSDLEQLYYRSDHYSYAAKGVPIIFFTTGLHPDYHANTDEVSRIEFDKMTRIAQLVFETGQRLANLDHALVRDHLGPRAGKGTRE